MTFNAYIKERNRRLGEKVVQELNSRHFEAYYVDTKKDALNKAIELIPQKDVVSWGGSMSISETGLLDFILKNGYKVINRDTAKNKEEKDILLRKALLCDTYLMGTNALTESGELVNIDCIGNRTAALMFGPKSVVILVGMNKVMPTLDDAIKRARNYAAPTNIQRVAGHSERQTPCFKTGHCHDCKSQDSICSHIVVTRLCNPKNRIKIILVGETIGF